MVLCSTPVGLKAYGVRYPDSYHRAATYVDKILKRAKPADLPVEQLTKFELVINLKTTKALGLTIHRRCWRERTGSSSSASSTNVGAVLVRVATFG